jgi:hypothetical protein
MFGRGGQHSYGMPERDVRLWLRGKLNQRA